MSSSSLSMVMFNGLPGAMATGCAEVALERGFRICPISLAGSREEEIELPNGGGKVQLYPKAKHAEAMTAAINAAGGVDNLAIVDYVVPAAILDNYRLYAKFGVSFVSGTTGFAGKPEELRAVVEGGHQTYAVIAPNMNKQIVAFQAMMEYGGKNFPGCFGGYSLSIKESHQEAKRDTSGTAKAVCGHMATMAADSSFTVERIEKIRGSQESKDFGVPEHALTGHAFHTYQFLKDEDVFRFQHNISGRRSYCEGTLDALKWLLERKAGKAEKRVYNMIDVLSG